MSWQTVIGLEIHAQLTTKSKLFSGASTAYGAEPNTNVSAIDLALPGTMPLLNRAVLTKAIHFALATDSQVEEHPVFERKHYFYPDLPKGYQTSQLDKPIVYKGKLAIEVEERGEKTSKTIRINRAHLEEDAGSSHHGVIPGMTGIDLNRAGTPLLEIVTEPDLSSAKEAVTFLRKLHHLVTWLGICDGNMQEGSFRCDANVSIHKPGTPLGTRTELKNINSFRFVEEAINYEVERQIEVLESGGEIVQETRLYDADKKETRSMRAKAEANDYRYFHDPDLLPIEITEEIMNEATLAYPHTPDDIKKVFIEEVGLSEYDAAVLVQSQPMSNYFTRLANNKDVDEKIAVNWLLGDVSAYLNEHDLTIEKFPINAEALGQLLLRIEDKTISNTIAKTVFQKMIDTGLSADEIIEKEGLKQVTDTSAIEAWVDEVIENNPKQVEQLREGQTKLMGFFVGQVMKLSQGKADPKAINQLLQKKLSNS